MTTNNPNPSTPAEVTAAPTPVMHEPTKPVPEIKLMHLKQIAYKTRSELAEFLVTTQLKDGAPANATGHIEQMNRNYGLPVNQAPTLHGLHDPHGVPEKASHRQEAFLHIMRKELEEGEAILAEMKEYEKLHEAGQTPADVLAEYEVQILAHHQDWLSDLPVFCLSEAMKYGLDALGGIEYVIGASNQTKMGVDGKPVHDETGKIVKGPNFVTPEPMLAAFIREQIRLHETLQYGDVINDGVKFNPVPLEDSPTISDATFATLALHYAFSGNVSQSDEERLNSFMLVGRSFAMLEDLLSFGLGDHDTSKAESVLIAAGFLPDNAAVENIGNLMGAPDDGDIEDPAGDDADYDEREPIDRISRNDEPVGDDLEDYDPSDKDEMTKGALGDGVAVDVSAETHISLTEEPRTGIAKAGTEVADADLAGDDSSYVLDIDGSDKLPESSGAFALDAETAHNVAASLSDAAPEEAQAHSYIHFDGSATIHNLDKLPHDTMLESGNYFIASESTGSQEVYVVAGSNESPICVTAGALIAAVLDDSKLMAYPVTEIPEVAAAFDNLNAVLNKLGLTVTPTTRNLD